MPTEHSEEISHQSDGAIELRFRCDFELTSAGHFERKSSVWHGTNEEIGPDHGVDTIPDNPTGFEGDKIIAGFLIDAEGFGMFEEQENYLIIVDVYLETSTRPTTSSKRFIYQRGMFENE